MYVLQCGARTGSVIDARRPGDIICAHGVECSSVLTCMRGGGMLVSWGMRESSSLLQADQLVRVSSCPFCSEQFSTCFFTFSGFELS